VQHGDEEKADRGVANPPRAGRPLIDVLAVQEIGLELGLGNPIRRLTVEFDPHPYGAGVGLLSALAQAIERQGADGLLIPIMPHGGSPVVVGG
jgi:hypothetical protein